MKISKRIAAMLFAMVLFLGAFPLSAFASDGIVYGIGFVDATSLRLRSEPSTASSVVAVANNKECVVVLSKTEEWYKVNYNLKTGYMHEDFLNVLTKENAELGYGTVNANAVNLRSGPSTGYGRVATAAKGSKCYILGINQGWYKVIYSNSICYIRSDYLDLTEIPYENLQSSHTPKFYRQGKSTGVVPSAAALNGNTVTDNTVSNSASSSATTTVNFTGAQILSKAQQYLGTPYVYGGASPSGFDCSGFVYYVLKSLGYSPYRTPADQYRHGTFVAKSNLQPGDIVFFANTYGSGISHVGIYAGNGQFIHSPNSRSAVSYSDLTTGYWANHYYGARRVA